MKVYIESLGCARNQIDSEAMMFHLQAGGCGLTDEPAEADVIVVNTCSFIEAAADESIDIILELARYKDGGRCRKLVVTGCLPERYREQIAAALPEVDLFLGTGGFDRILQAVKGTPDASRCLLPDPDRISTATPRIRASRPTAYLKIAEGCSKHCTYCIIPRLRGRQKSRPMQQILAEARQLISDDVRELVLVAQDTTAWGQDLGQAAGMAALLQNLADIGSGLTGQNGRHFWIRFLYGHPESIDDAVISTVARDARICSYFDIPIQHASNAVLKRMGRNYKRDNLQRLLAAIRRQIPEAALRTTVIVGFPGETESDFNQLLDFIEEAQFNHLGCFTYSDAADLPSHRLSDHVPEAVAQARYDQVMSTQRKIAARVNANYIGKTVPVLIEEKSETGLYLGRTRFQAPEVDGVTYVRADKLAVGEFASASIIDVLEYDLVGEPE